MELLTAIGHARGSLAVAATQTEHLAAEWYTGRIGEDGCLQLQTLGAPDNAIAYLFAADGFALVAHTLCEVADDTPAPPDVSVVSADAASYETALRELAGDLAASLIFTGWGSGGDALRDRCRQAADSAMSAMSALTRGVRDAADLR